MNTDARELTDEEINAREALGQDYERQFGGMKIVQTTNGSFSKFKDMVFTAVILGFAAVIWQQQATNATFEREIAVLNLECRNLAQARQP